MGRTVQMLVNLNLLLSGCRITVELRGYKSEMKAVQCRSHTGGISMASEAPRVSRESRVGRKSNMGNDG